MAVTSLLSMLTFLVYSLVAGGELSSEVIFPSLVLFSSLTWPLLDLPDFLTAVSAARLALQRLNEFFHRIEVSGKQLRTALPEDAMKQEAIEALDEVDEEHDDDDDDQHHDQEADEDHSDQKGATTLVSTRISPPLNSTSTTIAATSSSTTNSTTINDSNLTRPAAAAAPLHANIVASSSTPMGLTVNSKFDSPQILAPKALSPTHRSIASSLAAEFVDAARHVVFAFINKHTN